MQRLMIFFGLLVVGVTAEYAKVDIVTTGNCGAAILKAKGVDSLHYKPKLQFNPSAVRVEPARPKVPGCFRVIASNVTIKVPMNAITAEFEMHLSGDANPNTPTLKCTQKQQSKCGCGDKNACMYCDFCKNLKRLISGATINDKGFDIAGAKESCNCDVPIGLYDIEAEVCTPSAEELVDSVPTELVDYVSNGESFSLFTTMYIYDFRYNALLTQNANATAALKGRKAKGLVGCYVIGANVDISP